jgi:hypothetical protein
MNQTFTIVVALVGGLFSILTVFLNFQFTKRNMSHQGLTQFEEKRYQSILELYVHTYDLIERLMASQIKDEPAPVQTEFSTNSARMRLLAPTAVYEKYYEAIGLLESWSRLHAKTKPTRTKIGDQVMTMVVSPDPTAKYVEPAKEAHDKAHEATVELVKAMRDDLEQQTPHHSVHLFRSSR